MSRLPAHLTIIRGLLRRLNYHLTPSKSHSAAEPFDPAKLKAAEAALHRLEMPDEGGRQYLLKHIPRLARTLALVPPPSGTGRVLELGCYMQITPLLQSLCGYEKVHGAYYGPTGRVDHKEMGDFRCDVEHFDAERDLFPWPDGYFDTVIAGEIIEHMTYDPMHLLLESRRVLREGGTLILTTPNTGSVTSAAKALNGRDNPQIFFLYERPRAGQAAEIGHVREYTASETGETMKAAGFEVQQLFTTFIAEFASHLPLLAFLDENG
ncbi:MAG TPA: class I SAM-dependent methyltransferase, partial [Bryobacteraceae bacterium]|nr:class I SAM-dependent methyltransferase [Bryobacteraceae bacterium]